MKKFVAAILTLTLLVGAVIEYEFLDALKIFEDKNISNDQDAVENLVLLAKSDKRAAFLLAYYYKNVKYKNVDMQKSFTYYQKSAELGDIDAMLITGWNYYKGIGVSINIDKAKYFLEKAAIAGDKEAEEMLRFIF